MKLFKTPEDPLTADVPVHIIGKNGKLEEVGKIRSLIHQREDEALAASSHRTVLIEGHLAITTFDANTPQSR
ncbi:MAG: hypothetical protein WC851_00095 [Candidatus Shapirobacteria bacterium]|jgi:hypothetical protein